MKNYLSKKKKNIKNIHKFINKKKKKITEAAGCLLF